MRERTAEIDGHLVFWREAPGEGAPILWVHGVPDSSDLWLPLLERAGGVALDLPGFGRSGKRGDFPYSPEGYAGFLERFVDHLGLDRHRLVCHDWGGVALAAAARRPERVERAVAIDTVPLTADYRWHRVARLWRAPVLGELAMGATNGLLLRRAAGMPRSWSDAVVRHFDHGTQRAILRLYRSADPAVIDRAGSELSRLGAQTLVIHGERDPFIPARFAAALASRLPAATVEVAPGRGHWPWVGDDALGERILAFLAA